jgi:cell division protein FtsB
MATSEIFPIFQRTKRPMRPVASTVQRSGVAHASGAVPRSARPTAGSRPPRPAAEMPRSRPVRTREASEGNASLAASRSTQTSASVRPRLRSNQGAPTARSQTPSVAPVATGRLRVQAESSPRQLLAGSRSAVGGRTRQESRDSHPARLHQGDRPARRFLLRVTIALLVVAVGVFALAFLGVLPARTYFGQQDELVQKKARLVMLGERNGLLGNRVASLQSDQVVARIARDQFGMVAPGDTLTVLPGLRDESLSLNGDASNVVSAVPPADVAEDPALLSSLMVWLRQIVS